MKHKLLRGGLYLCLLLCLHISAAAQDSTINYAIKGILADSATHKPLEMATINLFSENNQLLQSALTRPDGSFVLKAVRAAKYRLDMIAVGFNPGSIHTVLGQGSTQTADLGIIYLGATAGHLKEVTVTANKPLVKRLVDGISYDLQADPESQSSSVLDMMRKVPFLTVDASGNILMKGNSSYKIFINGKPSSLVERNPKDVLRSMPASTIQRIEVITSPSAKYDAEGFAGIINIITNKKTADSYNGSLNLNERFPAAGPGFGASFAAKQGRFGLSVYTGGSLQHTPYTGNTLMRTATGADAAVLMQSGRTASDNRNGYLGTELSWEPDSLRLVSVQFNLNGNHYTNNRDQQTQLNKMTGTLLQEYALNANGRANGAGMDAAINFQQGFKKDKNRLLTFSYRYYQYRNDLGDLMNFSGKINFAQPDYHQQNNAFSGEHTFQADYVHPFRKLTMETGVKGIARTNNSDYAYLSFNAATGLFEPDTARSDRFNNQQYILSAYNSWLYSTGKWELRAGLRAEQTFTVIDFISSAIRVNQHYFNLLPSVIVNRKLTDNSSLRLDFTQRLKRPGINRLNPFVDRSNPNEINTGNPGLRAVLSNRIQAGYSKWGKLSLNIGADYTFMNNLDLKVTSFDSITHITFSTYENTGKVQAWDLNFYGSYQLTSKLNMGINGMFTYAMLQGYVNRVLFKTYWKLYSIGYFMGYKFGKGWRANMNASFMGPNPVAMQSVTNKAFYSSFSIGKSMCNDKLSLSLSVNNPFTTYRDERVTTTGPGFMEISSNQVYYRSFGCSINYHFGKLQSAVKKSRKQINNDDVSNGKGL